MNIIKKVITSFLSFLFRTKRILSEIRAELDFGKLTAMPVLEKTTKIVLGGTTYLVSSFFKKDSKVDAVDKVRRLIERDAENITEE